MAVLPTQAVSRTGLAPSYASAAGGGDKVSPGDHVFLHVKNDGVAGITVTIVTPNTEEGLAIADATVSVGAGADKFIGPLSARLFRASDGYASISYSAVTSVTVACLSA